MPGRRNVLIALSLCTVGLSGLTGCTAWVGVPAGAANGQPASAFSPRQPGEPWLSDPAAADVSVDTDIVYREVDGEEVGLDVCRAPETDQPQAAVVLIHGGGFAAGDKDTRQWQLICRWLADAGYVAVNVNYRLAPEYEFPAAIEDVQTAVEWTRSNASTYGIDPERVGVLGGSAGENLAQLLGTSGEGATTQGSRVASVVSLSGAADLTERALELGDPRPRQIRRVLDYLGCSELAGCPEGTAASPITHVDSTDPPFLLAQSEQESLPVEQTELMAEALIDAESAPAVLIQPGRAHATRLLTDPAVRAAVLDFLARTLS